MVEKENVCEVCKETFIGASNQKTCSPECAKKRQRKQQAESQKRRRRQKKYKKIYTELELERARINEEARKLHMSYGQYVAKFLPEE